MPDTTDLKLAVRDFWDASSCGEAYAVGDSPVARFEAQRAARWELERHIWDFARFEEGQARDVLEIGVGLGADHVEWARSHPRSLTGVDLTDRAIQHTSLRVEAYGLTSTLRVADAEQLPFADSSFDLVYSWGVLHHSPETAQAFREVQRVLRPGGIARIMIYHKYSLTGYMLWLRYALLTGRPFTTLTEIYAKHLESPGTKAYSVEQARALCAGFSRVTTKVSLMHGDLLEGSVGQRHPGRILAIAKLLWPRPLLRRIAKQHGLALMIEAVK